jgi:hypothetical protein
MKKGAKARASQGEEGRYPKAKGEEAEHHLGPGLKPGLEEKGGQDAR